MRILNVIFLFGLCLLFMGCSVNKSPLFPSKSKSVAVPYKSDLSKSNLKGKVKIITSTLFDGIEKDGEVQTGVINSIVITDYNTKGNVSAYHGSVPYEKTSWNTIFKFNCQGFVKGSESLNINARYGNTAKKESDKCDSKGNIIKAVRYDEKGEVTDRSVYQYDSVGNIIEWDNYKANGDLWFVTTYIFDSNSNMVAKYNFQPDVSFYDKSTFKYDDNSNQIERKDYVDGKCNYDQSSQYLKFDAAGNWLKKISFDAEKKPAYVTERLIEYYP
ncbi:MAG: hypothetical protein WCO63_14595 [Bacteroidota bacterium]